MPPLVGAVSAMFPPLLLHLEPDHRFLMVSTYRHFHTKYEYLEKYYIENLPKGFYHCETDTKARSTAHVFVCSQGGHISKLYVCDEKADCKSDKSDEEFCDCSLGNSSFCRTSGNETQDHVQCGPLFFKNIKGGCNTYTLYKTAAASISNNKFMCNSRKEVEQEAVNDLFPDCGNMAEDEPHLLALLVNRTGHDCTPSFTNHNYLSLPCKPGHSKCFNISQICSYKIDSFGNIFPCRNGGHMENCDDFECNAMFKCPGSYCVPWSYLCDGKMGLP